MTTSSQHVTPHFRPQLAVTSNRKQRPQGPVVPAGVPASAPPERCLRCFADISNLWHVSQLCDEHLDWEITQLRQRNQGSAE